MRPVLEVALGAALAACAVGVRAQAVTPAAVQAPGGDVWEQFVTANNLAVKGKTPFDLAMTFQLYDLNGKPSETGAVEEWWAAPGSQMVVVYLAGLNADGSAPEGADPALVRDAYLVKQLLTEAVTAVPAEVRVPAGLHTKNGKESTDETLAKAPLAERLTTKRVKFGKVALDCSSPTVGYSMNLAPTTLCVEPQMTDVLVLQEQGGNETILRPRIGKFHDTDVALDLRISYFGKDAIEGKLTTMKAFDPATSAVKLAAATGTKAGSEAVSVAGGVIAGRRLKFVEPVYPDAAKIQHVSGAVLLNASIGKDGRIGRMVPIASTAPMFTESAMQAVRGWVYSPYLLNGMPTEVDTTISVNFAINGN